MARSNVGFLIVPFLWMLVIRFVSAQSDGVRILWQLAWWRDFENACSITMEGEIHPTEADILRQCGQDLYVRWLTTPVCHWNRADGEGASLCEGLFLRKIGEVPTQKSESPNNGLPRLTLESLSGSPGGIFETRPDVLIRPFVTEEAEQIPRIFTRVGGYEGFCDGAYCRVTLPVTGEDGAVLEYWSMKGDGQQGPHERLRFRLVPYGGGYRWDVIGAPFWEETAPGSDVWDVFPPLYAETPAVLTQVTSPAEIQTDYSFRLLAVKLIRNGMADASHCPSYGLNGDGSPNGCGEEASAEAVREWQNRYDGAIYQSAKKQRIPPRLLKGLIAQESQFWPNSDAPFEYGFGKMTENGADVLLRWNDPYYQSVCRSVFPYKRDVCEHPYGALKEEERILLRGMALRKVGTEDEMDLIAATLRACMSQTAQIVRNVSGVFAFLPVSYLDLWLFTVADYYSGSGCLEQALTALWNTDAPLTWEGAKLYFKDGCSLAGTYVERVFQYGGNGAYWE